MPRRLLTLIVSLALLLPAGTLGGVLYVCRMTGDTGSSCCCSKRVAAERAASRAEPAPAFERPGCCDAEVSPAVERPASTPGTDFHVAPPALIARLSVELSVAVAAPELVVADELARGPPPRGAPTYLRNCALLS